ncbi:UNVERIFIED_CONTAM: hypothetical protein LK11_31450 [Mumia flava]
MDAIQVPADDPLVAPMTRLSTGRLPASADEAMISPGLADEAGLGIGDRLIVGDRSFTVTGTGVFGSLSTGPGARAFVTPGETGATDDGYAQTFVLDRADPVTWPEVRDLNRQGFSVVSRAVLADPPAESAAPGRWGDQGLSSDETTVLLLIAVGVVIQVVLLAGPAFAVGARRSERDLALVAAAGGSAAHLRRIVLAQAAVLGLGAALVGAALSVPAAALVVRVLVDGFGQGAGPFQVVWAATAGVVVLGVVAATIAALAPARRVAAMDVAAVLADRRPPVRSRGGWPWAGLALGGVGVALCATFGVGTGGGGEYAIAVGAMLMVVGAVFVLPTLLRATGRLAGILPVSLRLAVRDNARQTARSAPAVAAVMAVVGAATAFAIATASDVAEARANYVPAYPMGAMAVSTDEASVAEVQAAASRIAGAELGAARSIGGSTDGEDVEVWTAKRGDPWTAWGPDVLVASADDLAGWGIQLDPAARARLDDGGAVVADAAWLRDGQARLEVDTWDWVSGESISSRVLEVPAVPADLGLQPAADPEAPTYPAATVISPALAEREGLPTSTVTLYAPPGTFSDDQLAEFRSAMRALPGDQGVMVEDGPDETYTPYFVALALLGGLGVLFGALSATGLALRDARPDLATLAAVGASPATRRRVAAAQAGVIAVVGGVLGVAVGLVPGLAATVPLTASGPVGHTVDVPYGLIAVIALGVPLLAAALSGLFVRGRLPLVRRLAQ